MYNVSKYVKSVVITTEDTDNIIDSEEYEVNITH